MNEARLRAVLMVVAIYHLVLGAFMFFAPGGFERWFEDLARLISGDTPDLDGIVASAQELGTEIDFDSVPALIERHSLHFPGA